MDVFITSTSSFLPGTPIGNDEIADFLGPLDRTQEIIRRTALKKNGIAFRHFALNLDGTPRMTNAEMAAKACRQALGGSEVDDESATYIAAAASQGDLIAPGFASMVHAHTGLPPCEVSSFQSFCSSGVMGLNAAFNAIKTGEHTTAVVCASEFASRFLRSGYLAGSTPSPDTEFLRWGLSDGAGALVLQNRPNRAKLSLKVEFIDLCSFANQFETCMAGGTRLPSSGGAMLPWSNYDRLENAMSDGAFHLQQDFRLLDEIIPLGLKRYINLINEGAINPDEIDWLLCHFSSKTFHDGTLSLARKLGIPLPTDRVFTNLYEKGNTGSAAIFIMLDDLVRQKDLQPGQKILCMVPESGRFIISFVLLTVCGGDAETAKPVKVESESAVPDAGADTKLKRQLAQVWFDFEVSLGTVRIIQRMERGGLQHSDYLTILRNIRQQVVEGARWITRAASNMTGPALELRSLFIEHAREEHRDYELLEQNYVESGGNLLDIRNGEKNIGSEALSAWMFHKASQENPIDLLGAMFIIEGIGNRLAGKWASLIKAQLNLSDEQISFLAYHGENDERHLEKLWDVFESGVLTEEILESIVKVAKVTARLYRLQLEELDRI